MGVSICCKFCTDRSQQQAVYRQELPPGSPTSKTLLGTDHTPRARCIPAFFFWRGPQAQRVVLAPALGPVVQAAQLAAVEHILPGTPLVRV